MFIRISIDGVKYYYKNRNLNIKHNSYGCSCFHMDSYKSYMINGKTHNELGPAIKTTGHGFRYFLNDNEFISKSDWLDALKNKYDIHY
jgi:hypothetical protein